MTPEQNIIFDELEQKAQGKVAALLGHLTRMEGAAELSTTLPKIIGPTALLDTKKNLQRIWELFGLYLLNQGHVHEAIPLFQDCMIVCWTVRSRLTAMYLKACLCSA